MVKEAHVSVWRRLIRKLRTMFIAGLIVVVPIGLTIWIIVWLFNSIDGVLQPIILYFYGQSFTGIGIAITLILILVVGAIATNVLGRRMVRWGESMLGKIPVARRLYTALKDVFQSFSDTGTGGFLQVVLIEFPAKGMKTIGFITNEDVDEEGRKLINVFIPTAPNPTTGFLEIVREEDIIRTDISVDDALKMAVSGGRMSPRNLRENVARGSGKAETTE